MSSLEAKLEKRIMKVKNKKPWFENVNFFHLEITKSNVEGKIEKNRKPWVKTNNIERREEKKEKQKNKVMHTQ